jgi:hypothetical protein
MAKVRQLLMVLAVASFSVLTLATAVMAGGGGGGP